MATTVGKPTIGQRVYMAYSPAMAGKIVEVGKFDGYFYHVTVRWLNGKLAAVESADLRDFDALIEETRKKLRTHLKTLERLNAQEVTG